MKLNTKINILSLVTMFCILVASFTGIYFLYEKLALETEYTQLQNQADEFASVISSLDTVQGIEEVTRAYIPMNGALRIVSESGQSLLHLQSVSSAQKMTFEKIDDDEPFHVSYEDTVPVLTMEYPLIWPTHEVVSVQLVQTLPGIAKNMELLRWILVIMALIAILPIYFVSSFLTKIILTPIQHLTTTMKHNIENGSYRQIEKTSKSKDEIAQMTNTYNELMAQLQLNYERQQQFVGNASHELKTPLTVIDSYTQLLQRRGFSNIEMTKEAIDAIATQSKSMKQMIEQMLQLASIHEGVHMEWKQVEILPLLEDISFTMKQAYNTDIRIAGEPCSIISDEAKVKQLLYILLDNARKYSEQHIDVKVDMYDVLNISITDYGIGIPKEHIPHLFERFYRVDQHRNRQTGGTGLGLSIAAEIANLLRAKVAFQSEVGQGTTVIVTIPTKGGEQLEAK